MMKATLTTLVTWLPIVALATACGGGGRIGQPVVWPEPPETARIRFVTAFSSAKHLDRSGWAEFKRDVVGQRALALNQPMGLALSADGQRLYIADRGNRAILVANFKEKSLTRFPSEHQFADPLGVALDDAENLYVTDRGASKVIVLDKRGKRLGHFGGGMLEKPTGIVVDNVQKRVYVASTAGKRHSDKHSVQAYTLDGTFVRNVGVDEGQPTKGQRDGQFYFPSYLALDSQRNLYVSDTLNYRVQVFKPDGTFLRKYGKNGSGPGDFARLKGLAVDSFDNLYVVDSRSAVVQLFNQKFELLMWFAGQQPLLEYLQRPSCIAIDRAKNLIYVCEQNAARINVYELINTTAEDSFRRPEAAPAKGE